MRHLIVNEDGKVKKSKDDEIVDAYPIGPPEHFKFELPDELEKRSKEDRRDYVIRYILEVEAKKWSNDIYGFSLGDSGIYFKEPGDALKIVLPIQYYKKRDESDIDV
ncbi:MAG: hypothetical protein KKB03_00400 [Nanoarchaeota archaeon]|nr:hypothetical protein [Nanoarchaeota archaeon]MBU1135447.1 hypothetical protein [Nanoarchaeota archaeon]MBU2519689.1 hypothetical protein [Nanoarchaeota archaeon]